MPRWLSRSLWMIAQAAAIGGGTICVAPAAAGALYRCAADDVRHLGSDGRLSPYADQSLLKEGLGSFIIDTDTGAIRGGSGSSQWRIIQQGNQNSDFVATPGISERSAVTDYIRIRAWKTEPNVTYFRVGLTTVITGRCEVIR